MDARGINEEYEIRNSIKIDDPKPNLRSMRTIAERHKSCSVCGRIAEGFFCSEVCNKRAVNIWFRKQFEYPKFLLSDDFLNYHFCNLEASFEQTFLDAYSIECSHSSITTLNMMNVLESHGMNTKLSIECMNKSVKNEQFRIYLDANSASSEFPNLAIANTSSRFRSELIRAMRVHEIEPDSEVFVSHVEIESLTSLNSAAKKHLDSLFERRKFLLNELKERKLDQFTLYFLGLSSQLIDWIDLDKPISSKDFESYCSNLKKKLPLDLYAEFFDLLIVIQVHPFLPTLKIIEDLELGIPKALVYEDSSYRSELIQTIKRFSGPKFKGKTLRLLRTLEVIDAVVRGRTLEDIGQEMRITRERVRQFLAPVFAHVGVDGLISLRTMAQRDRQQIETQFSLQEMNFQSELTDLIRMHPGISITELHDRFPEQKDAVEKAAKRHRALVLERFPIEFDTEMQVRDDIINSLKDASLLAFPVTGNSYDELLENGVIQGVSRGRIVQVFGSWTAACEYAEVEPGAPLKNVTYVRSYGKGEMLRVVGQFLIDDDMRGRAGGVHSYGTWKSLQEFADILPSDGTIRNQVNSSWRRVKELALVELRSSWSVTIISDMEEIDE
jgi:hypothetical protein